MTDLPADKIGTIDHTMAVIGEIAIERSRQVEREGYSREHDDAHRDASLSIAAACYAAPFPVLKEVRYANSIAFEDAWPWDIKYDKRHYAGNSVLNGQPATGLWRRNLLVKAAALIVAEIERLDRLSSSRKDGGNNG